MAATGGGGGVLVPVVVVVTSVEVEVGRIGSADGSIESAVRFLSLASCCRSFVRSVVVVVRLFNGPVILKLMGHTQTQTQTIAVAFAAFDCKFGSCH